MRSGGFMDRVPEKWWGQYRVSTFTILLKVGRAVAIRIQSGIALIERIEERPVTQFIAVINSITI
jgi:hypothetical protein